MPTHHFGEAELALPPGWEDQSVTTWVLPRPGGDGFLEPGGAATLVVTRDYASVRALAAAAAASAADRGPAGDEGELLGRYADAQLAEAARRLSAYTPLGRREATIGGRRALVVESAWTLPNEWRLRQRQAFVRLGDRMLVFTLTARAEEFAAHEGVWAQALGSVRWRPGAGLPTIGLRRPDGTAPAGPTG